jgi:dienelactone hydrolase
LQRDLQENFLAVYDVNENTVKQLGSKELPTVIQTNEGDGEAFVGVTDFGKRVEGQWTGNTLKDIYAINVADGSKKLVIKDLNGFISPQYISPTGKYIMWYDRKAKNYFAYDGEKTRNITSKIKAALYDEENDTPDYPTPYGVMGWHEGDSAVYIYDKYDIWKVDPLLTLVPVNYLNQSSGRINKITTRYVSTDPEKRYLKNNESFVVRRFSNENKKAQYAVFQPGMKLSGDYLQKNSFGFPTKAKNANVAIFTKENYNVSPNLYVSHDDGLFLVDMPLSNLNPQQKDYNWGTAELIKWKAYNGKETQGIVYKPEDFDPKKKYPLICYFYETLSDGLYTYHPPSPTPSRLNISFFVSRGYVVLAPDIHYGTGHPAKDAYNHIVSGARYLVKQGYIDSTRMGIQGQSWGGIQVAQLVTMTKLFKAAWAGAPVANMTSAYGGIRWESGVNRQFQYEKSQSRIGATLWEKPNLYIENSPLFHLPNVTTPLVIMANDADGAVPWYQGIELFTAMRRLNKKVWMLTYNGEAHNLVERRNRKDIQIREQQYFDWLLKDDVPPKWITEGVPAVKKGKDWGLDY